jgi:hypothetical protein
MANEDTKLITRRQLLRRTLAAGAAVAGAGYLIGCDSKDDELSCDDASGLSADEQQRRTALQYTDNSPKPDQHCDDCQFYEDRGAGQCGGCTIMPGPVHPKGWCASYAPKQS